MIYLDWNATAPVRPEAVAAMEPFWRESFGNASSVHAAGRAARVAMDDAREIVAGLIGAEPREIIFTSGATEANNLAIQGAALEEASKLQSDDQDRRLQPTILLKRFVSSPVEHPSILEPMEALAARGLIEWARLPLDADGALRMEDIEAEAARKPFLAALMLANNETGRIYPVAEAAARLRASGAHVHSDLTQAVGRIPVNVKQLNLDSAALSAHKLGGPKGIGALYVRRGVKLEKVYSGGKQERSRRPGTENVPAIVGFGAAAKAAQRDLTEVPARLAEFRKRLWTGITELNTSAVLNTPLEHSVTNTLNVSFPGMDGHFLLQKLDLQGLCVSSGAACASGSPEPSPVLRAIGYEAARVRGAVRFSMGYATTEADIEGALKVMVGACNFIRHGS